MIPLIFWRYFSAPAAATPKPATQLVPKAPASKGTDSQQPCDPAPDKFSHLVDRKNGGAYYRKVTSSTDRGNRGIHGTGLLPTPHFDPSRYKVAGAGQPLHTSGPLDRPSVYMGGHVGLQEVDAGLTWDRVYDAKGRPTLTDSASGTDGGDPKHRFVVIPAQNGKPQQIISGELDKNGKNIVVAQGLDCLAKMVELRPDFAFRPFWRTTTPGGEGNIWHNPPKDSPSNMYFYPGDRFSMQVSVGGRDKVRLDITRHGDVEDRFSQKFVQPGFGRGQPQSFKRVNSIDQVGGERGSVMPTRTSAEGASWDEVTLLRLTGKDLPMTGASFLEIGGFDTQDHYEKVFNRSLPNKNGGERLNIYPNRNL